VKPVTFLGDSLKILRGFPDDARRDAGFQIDRLQRGLQPDDFKPMPSVGKASRNFASGATLERTE
jgi:phage-related protein